MHKEKLNELLHLLKETAWQIVPTTNGTHLDRSAEFPKLEHELLHEMAALLEKIHTQSDDNETRPQIEALINNYSNNNAKVQETLTEIKNALLDEAVTFLNTMSKQTKLSVLLKKTSLSAVHHLVNHPETKNVIIERLNSFNRISDILENLRLAELRELAADETLEKFLSNCLRQLKFKKYGKSRKGTFERDFIYSCQNINDETVLTHYMLGFIASLDTENEIVLITEMLENKDKTLPPLLERVLNNRRDTLIADNITLDEEFKFADFIDTILNAAMPEPTTELETIEATNSVPRQLNEILSGYYESDDSNPTPSDFTQLVSCLEERLYHLLTHQAEIPIVWTELHQACTILGRCHNTGIANGNTSIKSESEQIRKLLLNTILRLAVEKPTFRIGETGTIIDSAYVLLVRIASTQELHHFFTANSGHQLKVLLSNISHFDILNQLRFMLMLCSTVRWKLDKSQLIIKTLMSVINKIAGEAGQELLVDILLAEDYRMPTEFKTFALDCISKQNSIRSVSETTRLATTAYQAATSSSAASAGRKKPGDDCHGDENVPAPKRQRR